MESRVSKLSQLIRGNDLIVAPVALNPIMARMAEEAGFKAIYMSGGSLGWYKCVTEANITLPEMAQVAVDMRAVCALPIILDGGGGWGDPMHVHRTIRLTEAAGFQAIEIEDQLLPRRVEHHVGIEHLVLLAQDLDGQRAMHQDRFEPVDGVRGVVLLVADGEQPLRALGAQQVVRQRGDLRCLAVDSVD